MLGLRRPAWAGPQPKSPAARPHGILRRALQGDFDKQLSAVTSEREALTARLMAIQIDQGVLGVAAKRGLRATALPDITARARGVFRLVNGVPQAFEADGQTVRPKRGC